MKLYGRNWSRRELEARIGRIEQIGGISRAILSEGPEAGVEQIQVRTGSGLSYCVFPSRGMDIGLVELAGAALSWLSPVGVAHPAYYDALGTGWLRTAAGGLLMTCGLTQVGSPGQEGGELLGLHGRAHHTPARQVAAEGCWEGDEYKMCIRGQIEEASLFGALLRLTRTISSALGKNTITIDDEVANLGFEATPHMLLYHINLGFPLMAEDTQVTFPSRRVRPRETSTAVEELESWQAPQAAYHERVYYHEDLETDQDGFTEVLIHNPRFPFANMPAGGPVTVRIQWDLSTLPYLVQWKMPGKGMHVLGIEPANCHVEGRLAERERGTLVMLETGQILHYHLRISIDSDL